MLRPPKSLFARDQEEVTKPKETLEDALKPGLNRMPKGY
jgi:hypothetical protein